MRRIALIGLALLAMTISASARLGMAPMAAQDGGVIEVSVGAVVATAVGTADADTITGGTGAAVITNGVTIAAGKASLHSRSSFPLPGRHANGSDANGRAVEARPVR